MPETSVDKDGDLFGENAAVDLATYSCDGPYASLELETSFRQRIENLVLRLGALTKLSCHSSPTRLVRNRRWLRQNRPHRLRFLRLCRRVKRHSERVRKMLR